MFVLDLFLSHALASHHTTPHHPDAPSDLTGKLWHVTLPRYSTGMTSCQVPIASEEGKLEARSSKLESKLFVRRDIHMVGVYLNRESTSYCIIHCLL